jgi:hypothetical protein
MVDYNSFVKKILEIDKLHYFINFKKFDKEETELIKLICYKNQQLNLLSIKSNFNFQNSLSKKFDIFMIASLKKIIKLIYFLILNIFKKKKKLHKTKADIIFICSIGPLSQKDTIPIVNSFSNKIIVADKPEKIFKGYKKIYKNSQIINIRDYFKTSDYFLSLLKTIKFTFKFYIFSRKNKYFGDNIKTSANFFLRLNTYNNLINNIKSKKVFIDRGDGHGINYLISRFKERDGNNKVFSYGVNGLALGNDLISAHYLYSNIDYLFCYGELDKQFINIMFKKNKFKKLKSPNKIISVGSVRNFPYKHKKIVIKNLKKKFNFLYLKANPNLYDNLDNECFEKFCLFVKKNFPKSKIFVKERPIGIKNNDISKMSNSMIDRNLINEERIFSKIDLSPEDVFEDMDIAVGTHTSALAQAIYFNIPTICLDKKIMISSFSKFFCTLYINSIDKIETYKNKIIKIGNSSNLDLNKKNYLFKKVEENPYLNIVKIINHEN